MEQKIIIGVVALLIVGAVGMFFISPKAATTGTDVPAGKYTELAQCIKDSGATFYGAFWCPHCAAEKKLFGDAAKLLPYVECSTPDGNSQLPVCKLAGVSSYPTWVFKDESRLSGEIPLATLAQKTGCTLPEGDVPAATDTDASSAAN